MLDVPAKDHLEPVGFRWQAPAGWTVEPAALSPIEASFFQAVPDPVQKFRLSLPELSGSLILVPAGSWRVHHLPEHCLGPLGVEGSQTWMVNPELPVRHASAGKGRYTLVWWFEAPDRRTDDLTARAWADLSFQQSRWVMVSLLLDGSPSLSTLSLQLPLLARSVRAGLE